MKSTVLADTKLGRLNDVCFCFAGGGEGARAGDAQADRVGEADQGKTQGTLDSHNYSKKRTICLQPL